MSEELEALKHEVTELKERLAELEGLFDSAQDDSLAFHFRGLGNEAILHGLLCCYLIERPEREKLFETFLGGIADSIRNTNPHVSKYPAFEAALIEARETVRIIRGKVTKD